MACANTSWSEENLSCSICLDVFNSPVSTACGHNFCRTCITKFWDEQVQYKCPFCNKLFNTRPDLQVNTFLSELAAQIRTTVRVKEQPYLMCKKHERLLELFCQTEQVCVCLLCTVTDHKSHPVVPLKEEYEVKTVQLGKRGADVQQMIQERKLKIKEIKYTVELSNKDADREIAQGGQVFTALIFQIAKRFAANINILLLRRILTSCIN
uniref:Uncharacterized protein n=1 Tax=Gadus morhua TaxID=8049 RepID=A0A8C5CRK9_GADMO